MHLLKKSSVAVKASQLAIAKSLRRSNALNALALAVILTSGLLVDAQSGPEAYPQMASVEEYLAKDRGAETSMAQRCPRDNISRCNGTCLWEKWLRDRGRREEWVHVPG